MWGGALAGGGIEQKGKGTHGHGPDHTVVTGRGRGVYEGSMVMEKEIQ